MAGATSDSGPTDTPIPTARVTTTRTPTRTAEGTGTTEPPDPGTESPTETATETATPEPSPTPFEADVDRSITALFAMLDAYLNQGPGATGLTDIDAAVSGFSFDPVSDEDQTARGAIYDAYGHADPDEQAFVRRLDAVRRFLIELSQGQERLGNAHGTLTKVRHALEAQFVAEADREIDAVRAERSAAESSFSEAEAVSVPDDMNAFPGITEGEYGEKLSQVSAETDTLVRLEPTLRTFQDGVTALEVRRGAEAEDLFDDVIDELEELLDGGAAESMEGQIEQFIELARVKRRDAGLWD